MKKERREEFSFPSFNFSSSFRVAGEWIIGAVYERSAETSRGGCKVRLPGSLP